LEPINGRQSALASWNDGAVKSAILDFVARVTKEGGPEFAPPAGGGIPPPPFFLELA
jgi:hypothetical protein